MVETVLEKDPKLITSFQHGNAPHELTGEFYRYVLVDQLIPIEFKRAIMVVGSLDSRLSFVKVEFEKEAVNYTLTENQMCARGYGPKRNYFGLLSQIIHDIDYSLNMADASGGCGDVRPQEDGTMGAYTWLKGRWYDSEKTCFQEDPIGCMPKVLDTLVEKNYGNIRFSALFDDVPVDSIDYWRVPEGKLVSKGKYFID